jgi:hypothetical protein
MASYAKLARRLAQGFNLSDDFAKELVRIARSINELFFELYQGKINHLQAKQSLRALLPGQLSKHPDFTLATELLIGHALLYVSELYTPRK